MQFKLSWRNLWNSKCQTQCQTVWHVSCFHFPSDDTLRLCFSPLLETTQSTHAPLRIDHLCCDAAGIWYGVEKLLRKHWFDCSNKVNQTIFSCESFPFVLKSRRFKKISCWSNYYRRSTPAVWLWRWERSVVNRTSIPLSKRRIFSVNLRLRWSMCESCLQ